MIEPELPSNEKFRQKAVEKYQLLDTIPEESYDNITSLMAYICQTPISLITLLDHDRNFLKSHHGVDVSESPRSISFCGHAINAVEDITIIEDARQDKRFVDNPLVTEMQAVFYAGVPLVDPSGFKLGTLCVYDHKPRKLNADQLKAMKAMSKQVINLFDQRYKNLQLMRLQEQLIGRNMELKKFAATVSHDLKSPLANISSLTDLLEGESKGKLTEDAQSYLVHLRSSSNQLRRYVDGILEFYHSEELLHHKSEKVSVADLMTDLKEITITKSASNLTYESNVDTIAVNRAAIMQIMLNLIVNGLKYNTKAERKVHISIVGKEELNTFIVSDNGDGMPEKFIARAFDLFAVSGMKDRRGELGTGIGLATVKKLVESLGGSIKVTSKEKEGTTFTFYTTNQF
ncbi:ATP-binding protein [Reichenbachiella carrageenanivorans]|uniref:histidine kinase n=1 Tax=Reichenbachiella carrageenanivorans TaxID=2979869 RepID=A0ABY6CZT6_9BACT|nr:ATP-binding protein [Reichenbachiella carrageenanivorans]UXX78900.1 ATP-binding protein [Reichenbachiella carrageenanivorans]